MAGEPSTPAWSGRYRLIALICRSVASIGGLVWALVGGAGWASPVAWPGGWLIFLIALWWAVATMRESGQRP